MVKALVRLFYPRMEIKGRENLPGKPCIIVGNHSQMHGPIACELFMGEDVFTWCTGEMMQLSEVPAYAYRDFWSEKPGYIRWFYKILSYLIAPLSVCVFNNARTIPVYRDARLRTTFRETMDRLDEGSSVVIFPEHDVPCDNILYDFQDRFIDLAKLYYKKSGKELCFVPMYIAPGLKSIYLGRPVQFSAASDMKAERQRICSYLMDGIRNMARALPEHTVVPYKNVAKKLYPKNTEVPENEKACC